MSIIILWFKFIFFVLLNSFYNINKMNKLILTLSIFCIIAIQSCTNKVTITVDQSSSNSQNLTFKTINKAIDKAYQIKSDKHNTDITINILAGEYNLSSPITITSELNGLTIQGSEKSQVTLKGSKPLNLKWEKYNNNIYVAKVGTKLKIKQFIVNDQLQILARYPDFNPNINIWNGYAEDAISKERIKTWSHPEGAILNALHKGKWGSLHYIITGLDKSGNAILEGGQQNNRPSSPNKEYRMVENVFEELDSPGEFYYNQEEGNIYFWPTKNIDIANTKCEAVVLKNLITLKGSEKAPIKNIKIKGIKFKYAQRTLFEKYEPLLRSDWRIYRGGAVFINGAEDCSIKDCEFANLGGNVIFISGYNRSINISGNHIHDCGASAICFVGDTSAVRSPSFQYGDNISLEKMDTISGPKNNLYPKNCIAENNLIHRIGRFEKQGAGVEISMSMNITVSHNSIYDVPRAGINIGDGTWGGHIIEYNDVFNTVLETGDHGSFNSWGRDRFWNSNRNKMNEITTNNPKMPLWDAIHTTEIKNNRFRCDHGWDIDLDDGSTNYHIYNNLCLNGGIKLREGFYRVVENNITVNNTLHPHVWFANCDDVFRYNIVNDSYKDVNVLSWGKEMDYNLFPNEESLTKAQIYNIDKHSSFGNPLFVSPKTLDFSVSKDSPALKLGFKNFPMNEFGVTSPDLKKIAKTPEVPIMKNANELKHKTTPIISWLRNDIKSVESEQEQSAYGLNSPYGVIILKMWKGSYAAQGDGLKNHDVILKTEGIMVKNVNEFFKVLKKYNSKDSVTMTIMRNQSEKKIRVHIK